MTRLRLPLLLAVATLAPAGAAKACWCSRAYTRSYFAPCVTCPTVSRSYYVPVATCPTTTCSTTSVERCYYEPQVAYQTRTVLQPQTAYVRRSYYDPITCCYRSYWLPTTQFVERSYQVPVTTWTKTCSTEPATTCTTSYSQTASYWSPDGYNYYPVAPTSVNCAIPESSGSTKREAGYGPESPKSNGKTDPPKAPEPKPMPSKPSNGDPKTYRPPPKPNIASRPITATQPPSLVYYNPAPRVRWGP
jgi:hypothetical protein